MAEFNIDTCRGGERRPGAAARQKLGSNATRGRSFQGIDLAFLAQKYPNLMSR
jgi:hypothetical protein